MFEELPACPVARPVACRYDFLEVRCGGPWLSALLCDRLCVGPVVDFTVSPFFSLCDPRCLEWIHFMLQEGRLKSLLVVPPVGSFSPAWKPRIRAWDPPILRHPCPRARREDAILGAAISTLLVATRCNALAMVLRPLQSFARGSAPWRHLCIHRGAVEATLCACDAFSAGRQAAVVLVAAPGARALAPQISDITVESGSSSSERLAAVLAGLVRARPPAPAPTKGLESLLFNDVMLTARWRVSRSWPWRDRAHINVLEVRAFLCELKDRAACGDDARFVHGLDSYVALGALTKGRTSSLRLLPLVKQSAAIQAAFGQYPALHFCPTRLNASDDPTRGVDLRSPVPASIASGLPASCLYEASCLLGLSKASSGWLRLALLYFRLRLGACCGSLVRSLTLRPRDLLPAACVERPPPGLSLLHQDFDSTLGFPGEGPGSAGVYSGAAPSLAPRDRRDEARARARSGANLGVGRPVLDRTSRRTGRSSWWLLALGWLALVPL